MCLKAQVGVGASDWKINHLATFHLFHLLLTGIMVYRILLNYQHHIYSFRYQRRCIICFSWSALSSCQPLPILAAFLFMWTLGCPPSKIKNSYYMFDLPLVSTLELKIFKSIFPTKRCNSFSLGRKWNVKVIEKKKEWKECTKDKNHWIWLKTMIHLIETWLDIFPEII